VLEASLFTGSVFAAGEIEIRDRSFEHFRCKIQGLRECRVGVDREREILRIGSLMETRLPGGTPSEGPLLLRQVRGRSLIRGDLVPPPSLPPERLLRSRFPGGLLLLLGWTLLPVLMSGNARNWTKQCGRLN